MSQSSSSPASVGGFVGSPSVPAFFDDTSGYPSQVSRFSPEESPIDLNAVPLFNESPALRRTPATSQDATASRGLLFGNQLGHVSAIYNLDLPSFIVFPG